MTMRAKDDQVGGKLFRFADNRFRGRPVKQKGSNVDAFSFQKIRQVVQLRVFGSVLIRKLVPDELRPRFVTNKVRRWRSDVNQP